VSVRRARVVLVLKSSRCAPWVVPQVDALRARGHEIVALLPAGDGPVRAALRRRGVAVVDSATDFALRPGPSTVAGLLRLRGQLRDLAPDVLVYHLYAAALATRLATLGLRVPRVHMVPGPLYLDSPLIRAAERALARLDTVTIGGSEYTAARYRALGRPVARSPAIPYGVDTGRFHPATDLGRQDVRAALGVEEDAFLAIMVAYVYAPKRLVHRGRGIKGHADLLSAWRRFAAEHPGGRLLIVGGGFDEAGERHRRDLAELYEAERHGVIWLDTVSDVRPYYAAADVSVSPSLSDNHGAALEAGAMGVPSIVSDAGALPETVGPGCGWVFPAGDHDALAATLAQAHAAHPAGGLAARGARAREWVATRFDADRAAGAVADVVESTLPTRSATASPVITLCTEARFGRDGTGRWAAVDAVLGAAAWSRYLADGARLRIVARADTRLGAGTHPLPDGVEVVALPSYAGLAGLVRALPRLVVAVGRAVARADVLVVRVPGAVGTLAALAAAVLRRRYAAEVVGDPYDVLSADVLGTAGRSGAGPARTVMRRVVRGAAAVQYVTERVLQEVYPPAAGVPVVAVSNVRLPASAIVASPRTSQPVSPRVLTVGSQAQRYKGHDVLLRALRVLADDGLPVCAVIVGGGRWHGELVALVDSLGLADRVVLTGAVHDRDRLTALFDSASVFAMPSRTEGLPRALLEAMARALPAVGSAVGGIPELLDPRCLVPVDDHRALAAALSGLLLDDAAWAEQSARNLDTARRYELWRLEERFHKWLLELPRTRR
jgi:glycosyltransferase involved in cell wall biosynthesis